MNSVALQLISLYISKQITFLFQVTVFTITTLASALPPSLPTLTPEATQEQQPKDSYAEAGELAQSSNTQPALSTYLPLIQKYLPGVSLTIDPSPSPSSPIAYTAVHYQQLPKVQAPAVPFYSSLPSTVLTVPHIIKAQPVNNYYEVPVPSQELQVPGDGQWNPLNDPMYMYDAEEHDDDIPTNLYPKKYNHDLHATVKPYAIIKDELNQYVSEAKQRQKDAEKNRERLAKLENLKLIQEEKEKVQKAKKNKKSKSKKTKKDAYERLLDRAEPQAAASGFLTGYDFEGYSYNAPAAVEEEFSDEVSSAEEKEKNPPALGPGPKERTEFQMHGHDGPHSYKWGFDHGEG